MMADRVYFKIHPDNIRGKHFILEREESDHFYVLRKEVDNLIWLLDGNGTTYTARIDSIKKGAVKGTLLETHTGYGENPIKIHLVLAILKGKRMEQALEQATEMGVTSISLLLLDRCIKRTVKPERLHKIFTSATKQCGRSVIPFLTEPVSLEEWIDTTTGKFRIVCHSWAGTSLTEMINGRKGQLDSLHLVVGPEGDFSPNEIDLFRRNNINFVALGPRRLRSETAVVTALAIINELVSSIDQEGQINRHN